MHTRRKAEPPDLPDTGIVPNSMRLQTPSPSSTQTEVGEPQQNTPENVSSSMIDGRPRGDSGHALEDLIFGGRLRHRHLIKRGLFQEQSIQFSFIFRRSHEPL